MEFGVSVRTMGDAATRDMVLACTRAAEEAGLDEIWLPDHIAIPPDDAEGSGGRYLDVMATIAFLAAATDRIGLGTGILVLPYRRPLNIARWAATIQELSGERLRLGVGIGWMAPEFKALGLSRSTRGADSDAALDLLHRCFGAEDDVVEAHGQRFLFRPRPARPPIFVGGGAPHALARAARYGDGWMPMGGSPRKLAEPIAELRERFAEAGRGEPEVIAMTAAMPGRAQQAAAGLAALAEVGVTRVLMGGGRYATVDEFRASLDAVVESRELFGR